MKRLFSLVAGVVVALQSCRTAHTIPLWSDVCTQDVVSMDFCNSTLDLEARVADYVRRIPLRDQINMMNNNAEGYEPMHIPPYQWWSEGLHGGVGRIHMYYTGNPEFSFGHGLSYSRWKLEWEEDPIIELHLFDPGGQNINVPILLYNQGPYEGSQTILLFWRPLLTRDIRQKLIGFRSEEKLRVGENKIVKFQVKWDDFGLWSERDEKMVVFPGMYQLEASISNVRIKQTVRLVDTKFRHTTIGTTE